MIKEPMSKKKEIYVPMSTLTVLTLLLDCIIGVVF